MQSNFLICLQAVLPLLVYLVIGLSVRRAGLITRQEVHRFNHLVFLVFFPPLMFEHLYTAKLSEAFYPHLVLYAVAFVPVLIALSVPLVYKLEKKPESRGAMIQGIYRSNFVLMGLPVAVHLFGKGGAGVTAALIMVVVPLYNVLAVVILEYYRGSRPNGVVMIRKILTNPILLGAAAAVLALLLGIRVPKPAETVIAGMSAATTPIALILLGASVEASGVWKSRRNLTFVVLMRLVVAPAIGLFTAALLGFRGAAFVSLLVMMAAPTAVSSFTMAESMESDGELAGQVVIVTTPLSVVTLFLWLFLFKSMGLF